MSVSIAILKIIAGILGIITAFGSILMFIRLRWPAMILFVVKLYISAISPILVLSGLFTTIVGLATQSKILSILGFYNIFIYLLHITRVTSAPANWNAFIELLHSPKNQLNNVGRFKYILPKRNALSLPSVPKARISRDLAFAKIPGTDRSLLCDLWQPPPNVPNSGLALIYLHGSAWYLLDKDLGTRPFFKYLAAQGHVIMDVAYRLAPEADMLDMIQDVKRAIKWMKDNAREYGCRPDTIVLCGGSAGGHLALMAAYTSLDPQFIPDELESTDLKVQGVISMYGPTDLTNMYYYTNQHITTRPKKQQKKIKPPQMPMWVEKSMGENYKRLGFDKGFENAGAFAPLLGGHPDEIPGIYQYFSPISHTSEICPPTLLIHGAHDLMAPLDSSRKLLHKLQENKVPALLHILPQTDHAFDLIVPQISPSAHNAIYDIERFLFAIAEQSKNTKVIQPELAFS